MNTLQLIENFFNGDLIHMDPEDSLETKKELKSLAEARFKAALEDEQSALLSFHVLYHRLGEISKVAKDVFYEDAIKELRQLTKDEEGHTASVFGTKAQLRESDEYKVAKSPKIVKLEKEIAQVEKKNQAVVKKYEKFQSDIKSLKKQIKAEEENIISQGLAKKVGTKESISLSY